MKPKDFHPLVFGFYLLQENRIPKIRPVTGRAVVRWKTQRKRVWEERNGSQVLLRKPMDLIEVFGDRR